MKYNICKFIVFTLILCAAQTLQAQQSIDIHKDPSLHNWVSTSDASMVVTKELIRLSGRKENLTHTQAQEEAIVRLEIELNLFKHIGMELKAGASTQEAYLKGWQNYAAQGYNVRLALATNEWLSIVENTIRKLTF